MFVAISRFEIFIPGGRSLKAKRSVVSSIKERVRSRFRAAVAEVDTQELWQRATLGVALVGQRPGALGDGLAAIRRLVEENSNCQLVSWDAEVRAFEDLRAAPGSRPCGTGEAEAEAAGRSEAAGPVEADGASGTSQPRDPRGDAAGGGLAGSPDSGEPAEWYETEDGDETFGGYERLRREGRED